MNISKPSYDYQRHQEIVRAALPCEHPIRELRHKRDTRGVIRLREQCPNCGCAFSGEKRHTILNGAAPDSVPPWDYAAEQRYLSVYLPLSRAIADRINSERSQEWWRQYAEYLASPEWQAIRNKAIDAAGGICIYCRVRPAIQVHHETYERVGHEVVEDLSAVCIECHQQLHGSPAGGPGA